VHAPSAIVPWLKPANRGGVSSTRPVAPELARGETMEIPYRRNDPQPLPDGLRAKGGRPARRGAWLGARSRRTGPNGHATEITDARNLQGTFAQQALESGAANSLREAVMLHPSGRPVVAVELLGCRDGPGPMALAVVRGTTRSRRLSPPPTCTSFGAAGRPRP